MRAPLGFVVRCIDDLCVLRLATGARRTVVLASGRVRVAVASRTVRQPRWLEDYSRGGGHGEGSGRPDMALAPAATSARSSGVKVTSAGEVVSRWRLQGQELSRWR